MNPCLAEPLQHGLVEYLQQLTAMNRELGPVIARGAAARLGPDALAVFGVEDQLAGGNADRGEAVQQTKFGQLANRMRQDVDADAQLTDGVSGFINIDLAEAGVMERQGQRHTADTTTDNGDFHPASPTARGA